MVSSTLAPICIAIVYPIAMDFRIVWFLSGVLPAPSTGPPQMNSSARSARSARNEDEFPIAILGAGFAGIGMAIQLLRAGIRSFQIFEQAGEIGGTWRDNTYPGAACDVPSHVYSFSFEPNPNWSRAFAESGEIQEYLLGLVEKWKLRQYLRLHTRIVRAEFDASSARWHLTSNHGEAFEARVVLSGVGGLVDPSLPDIDGIEDFEGETFHTARWNHDFKLAGKHVAVIGTGASGIQVIPEIAREVARLDVFQRTPHWVMPKRDRSYSERTRSFYARHPFALQASRKLKYWASELIGPMVFLDSPRISSIPEKASLMHLEASVSDPVLREKLTPDFQFGCKRVLISDEYWQTFERENVQLVTESIRKIRSEGVETSDGIVRELDAIVFATGFALNIATAPFPVVGLRGKTLDDVWKHGAVAYKGMSVSGFPNWFIMMGPNTGPGHTSVLVFTEAQIQHALGAIHRLRSRGGSFLHVKQSVQDRYNESIQGRMKYTSWSSGCNSWYLSEDGSNHSLFPGFAAEYVMRARRFRASDYNIVD
jgi:cation diffusion facilitator CzcD-associated flavoprotein CzcO